MKDRDQWRRGVLDALQMDDFDEALDAILELEPQERSACLDQTLSARLMGLLRARDRTRQRRAADALARLAPDAPLLTAALREALDAPDPRVRWGAAYTLGHALIPAPAKIWSSVRETLELEDGDQRWAAAELTRKLICAHPSVRSDVLRSVNDGSATMRRMLLYCLRDIDDPDLLVPARRGLGHEDAGVRLAALSAAAQVRPSPADRQALADQIAPLVLDDPAPGVRRAAAITLGKLDTLSPSAIATLRRAKEDADPALARAAASALVRQGHADPKN